MQPAYVQHIRPLERGCLSDSMRRQLRPWWWHRRRNNKKSLLQPPIVAMYNDSSSDISIYFRYFMICPMKFLCMWRCPTIVIIPNHPFCLQMTDDRSTPCPQHVLVCLHVFSDRDPGALDGLSMSQHFLTGVPTIGSQLRWNWDVVGRSGGGHKWTIRKSPEEVQRDAQGWESGLPSRNLIMISIRGFHM